MGMKIKPSLTAQQRRNLGHIDFNLGYSSLVLSVASYFGSKLWFADIPKAPEVLGVSSILFLATALLGIAMARHNLIKSAEQK